MWRPSDKALGLMLVALSEFILAAVALAASLAPLPLVASTEARFLATWAIASVMLCLRWGDGLRLLGPPQLRGLLLLRGGLIFAFVTSWWGGLRQAPVGNCVALFCCAPVLSALWAKVLREELLQRTFSLQVLLAAVGAVLVLDPPFLRRAQGVETEPRQEDYRLVLLAMVLASTIPVITRATSGASWIEVEHVCGAVAGFALNPGMVGCQYMMTGSLPDLSATTVRAIMLVTATAVCSAGGVALQTRGFQLADPGKAALLLYLQVPFAYGLQLAFTGAPARPRALLGSALIFSSVLLSVAEQRLAGDRGYDGVASSEDAPEAEGEGARKEPPSQLEDGPVPLLGCVSAKGWAPCLALSWP